MSKLVHWAFNDPDIYLKLVNVLRYPPHILPLILKQRTHILQDRVEQRGYAKEIYSPGVIQCR